MSWGVALIQEETGELYGQDRTGPPGAGLKAGGLLGQRGAGKHSMAQEIRAGLFTQLLCASVSLL